MIPGNAAGRLSPDTYTVTVTAENSAGTNSDTFTLTVEAPSLIAPTFNKAMYANQMTQGTDYTAQFTATGSEPLTWSLEPVTVIGAIATVPAEASIDSKGKLTINGSIAVGTYSFIVKVTNAAGFDSFEFTIMVQAALRRIIPQDKDGVSLLTIGAKAPSVLLLSAGTGQAGLADLNSTVQTSGLSLASDLWQISESTGNARSLSSRAAYHVSELKWQDVFKNAGLYPVERDWIDALRKIKPIPKNKTTIRWDDPKDIYTNDRDTVNGAEYVLL